MTYTGAMVLPQNAVRMNTNEMRYVDGGKTWSHTFTTQNKLHKYQYKVTIKDLTAGEVAIAAGSIILFGAALTGVIGAAGTTLVKAIAEVAGSGLVGIGSVASIKKKTTVTLVKKYY